MQDEFQYGFTPALLALGQTGMMVEHGGRTQELPGHNQNRDRQQIEKWMLIALELRIPLGLVQSHI